MRLRQFLNTMKKLNNRMLLRFQLLKKYSCVKETIITGILHETTIWYILCIQIYTNFKVIPFQIHSKRKIISKPQYL